jgi:hypothetical protein
MAAYKLGPSSDLVQRTSDGAWVPNDLNNIDWRAYQAWLAAGNQPDPADAPPAPSAPPLTADQLAAILIAKAGVPLTAQDVTAAKSIAHATVTVES